MAAAAACASPDARTILPGPDPASTPRYSQVWFLSTHNAYWVDRGVKNDDFASGTQSRLLDQLLVGRARSIEIDVHHSPDTPQKFDVYHTTPGNVLCDDLARCLAMVRAFEWALPQHEPLQITIELKELFSSLWDDAHTIEDFDRVVRDELGDHLYAPKDFLARCDRDGTHESMQECMARKSWPGVDELRGKVIVAAMGNWDDLGQAQSTSDWARYATKDDVRLRAAFPMASSWKLTMDALNDRLHDLLTQDDLDRAYAASAFLQIEDPTDANASPFLGKNGVIRVDNSFTLDDQRARVAQRMQMLQTDAPWSAPDDGASEHAMHPFDGSVLVEPGTRVAVNEAWFASTAASGAASGATSWETAISSGDTNAEGCVRAETTSGKGARVCRKKIPSTTTPSADAERAIVSLRFDLDGAPSDVSVTSIDPSTDGVGDLVALGHARSERENVLLRAIGGGGGSIAYADVDDGRRDVLHPRAARARRARGDDGARALRGRARERHLRRCVDAQCRGEMTTPALALALASHKASSRKQLEGSGARSIVPICTI